MTQSPPLTLEVADGIATLTMTRSKQRNPFTLEFTDAITARPVLSVAPLRTTTVHLISDQIRLGRMVPT